MSDANSQRADAELARAIADAASCLSRAINRAAAAGLETEIDVLDVSQLGAPSRATSKVVTARVSRPIRPETGTETANFLQTDPLSGSRDGAK